MPDVVVTVPKGIWWDWIYEGDAVGARESGEEWGFFLGRAQGVPDIRPGERVYVVAHGRLRGYSPLTRLQRYPLALGRRGGAVAVTIPEPIVGFRGWRYRWWERAAEVPFPRWRTEGVPRSRDPLLVELDARAEDGGEGTTVAQVLADFEAARCRVAPLAAMEREGERPIHGEPFMPGYDGGLFGRRP